MWSDRVSNPGPLDLESDALPIASRGLAPPFYKKGNKFVTCCLIVCRTKFLL